MSVDGNKPLTKGGALEVLNAFAHTFAEAGADDLCLWADKLEKWLREQACISKTRPFKRGDLVNVLSIERGKYLRERVLVMENEGDTSAGERLLVTDHEGLSIEDAERRGEYWDYPYHRLELVQAVDEEGGQA